VLAVRPRVVYIRIMSVGFGLAVVLMVVLPMFLWRWRIHHVRMRARREAFVRSDVGRSRMVGSDKKPTHVRSWLWLLGFACLSVSLWLPRCGERVVLLPRRGIDIVFAVDVSRSMRARDVVPDRLERVKAEVGALLPKLAEQRVGLVAFAGTAFVQCPLTTDAAAVELFLRDLSPDVVQQGGTDLAAGIQVALHALEAENPAADAKVGRLVVVLTDGEDHEGGMDALAADVKQSGASVLLIGVGGTAGEPIPVTDPSEPGVVRGYLKDRQGKTVMSAMNAALLRSVGQQLGARVVIANDTTDMGMTEVMATMNTLEKRALQGRSRVEHDDAKAPWLLASLVLWWVALVWPDRRRRTVAALMLACMATGSARAQPASDAAPATSSSLIPTPRLDDAATRDAKGWLSSWPLQRQEPHLSRAVALLEAGELEDAVGMFRRAQTTSSDERLMVDYDATVTQLAVVTKNAEAAAASQASPSQAPPAGPQSAPQAPNVEEERAALRLLAEGFSARSLRSEAWLARGTASLVGQKLDDAIADYRQALRNDPSNVRAARNLQRALMMKQAQPPPPPQSSAGEPQKDPQKQEQDKQDQQQQQQQQQEQNAQQQEQGDNDQPEKKDDAAEDKSDKSDDQQAQEQEQEPQEAEQKPPEQKGGNEQSPEPQEEKPTGNKPSDAAAGQETTSPPTSTKALLQSILRKDKPLAPFRERARATRGKRAKEW
jgi:Ca-activated chloride channel homolog